MTSITCNDSCKEQVHILVCLRTRLTELVKYQTACSIIIDLHATLSKTVAVLNSRI